MKGEFFKKKNLNIYFVLFCIIFIGIVIFYLSCKSKSPTEPSMSSSETLAAQGSNDSTRTSTTSSTTTTTKPANASNTTTTLITSRTLTTTSIRSSTSSTTTIIEPAAFLKFCTVVGTITPTPRMSLLVVDFIGPTRINIVNGSTVYTYWGAQMVLDVRIKNIGSAPANNIELSVSKYNCSDNFEVELDTRKMAILPNNGGCYMHPAHSTIVVGQILLKPKSYYIPSESCKFILKLFWEGATHTPTFHFILSTDYYQ